MSTVCVACCTESTGMINIYHHPLELDVMFNEITGVDTINSDDHLCILCYDTLKEAHNFRKKCQQSYWRRQKQVPTTYHLQPLQPDTSPTEVIDATPDDTKDLVDSTEEPQEDPEPDNYAESDQGQAKDHEEEETYEEIVELLSDHLDEEANDEPMTIDEEIETTNLPASAIRQCRKKRCKNPDIDMFNGLKHTTCECCFKQFEREEDLQEHHKDHFAEVKPYRCKQPGCQSRFKDRAGVRNHYRAHVEGKKYVCNVCQQGFSQKGNLTVHQRIHEGVKPFSCPTCGKSFSENGNLKTHMRHHNDERPYKCNYCEKSFRTHYSHKIHERSHTNERPFGCDLCGKTFYSSGKLANHRRIHTNERKYVCTEPGCKAAFIESNGLRRHRSIHSKTTKDET